VLAISLSSCAPVNDSSKKLTFVSFGSNFQENQKKAWQVPYTEQTGTEFRNDSPSDIAKIKTMVASKDVSWDIVGVSGANAEKFCGELFEKIDTSKVDTKSFTQGTTGECGVPAYLASLIFVYNSSKYGSNPPRKISDFFDTATYPGKRALPPQFESGVLEQALLGDGVPRESLYPLDIPRALSKLGTIKSSLVFSESYGQLQQMMVDQQVDMALMSTNRTYQALKSGAKISPVWDSTIISWDVLAVPKGSRNVPEAMDFISFAGQAEQQAALTELTTVGSANPKSSPKLDQLQQDMNAFSPAHEKTLVYSDVKWWAENLDNATSLYSAWKVG
jgi:putative spermidine/putrescine transport system substrate-binding protein